MDELPRLKYPPDPRREYKATALQRAVIEHYVNMLPVEAPRQTLQKLRELIVSLEQAA